MSGSTPPLGCSCQKPFDLNPCTVVHGSSEKASEKVSVSVKKASSPRESMDASSRGAAFAVPKQVHLMEELLESMGITSYEPNIVHQLLEYMHRYTSEILIDASEYSLYADKKTIDQDDVTLAIQSRLNHHFTEPPPRDMLMELAERRNCVPLPPIPNEYGIHLPPQEHQLTMDNIVLQTIPNGSKSTDSTSMKKTTTAMTTNKGTSATSSNSSVMTNKSNKTKKSNTSTMKIDIKLKNKSSSIKASSNSSSGDSKSVP